MTSTGQPTEIISHGPAQTFEVARELLAGLRPGTVLAFHGQLGAGKTCFIQGLAKAMGVERAVSSPTFTLINEYHGSMPLYHIDLYRISGPDEALGLGLEEYLESDGVTAIEWAERVNELLPATTIHIRMRPGEAETDRIIQVERGEDK